MKCIKCGVLLPSDAKFCDKCGAAQQKVQTCKMCHVELAEGASFCHVCGASQQEIKTQEADENYKDEYSEINKLIDEWMPKIFTDNGEGVRSNLYTYKDVQDPKNVRIFKNLQDNMLSFYYSPVDADNSKFAWVYENIKKIRRSFDIDMNNDTIAFNIPISEIRSYADFGDLRTGIYGIIFTKVGLFYKWQFDRVPNFIVYDKISNVYSSSLTLNIFHERNLQTIQTLSKIDTNIILKKDNKITNITSFLMTDDMKTYHEKLEIHKNSFSGVSIDTENFERFMKQILSVL